MADEVVKFDPSTLMQGVKDRIKSTFVSLVPDEAWEAMVKKEVDEYFKPRERYENGYSVNNKIYKSEFDVLVRQLLEEESKKRVADFIKEKEFTEVWDTKGQKVAATALEEIIVKNSGAILVNILQQSFQAKLYQFESNLRNNNYR